jgi:hypothetical protein
MVKRVRDDLVTLREDTYLRSRQRCVCRAVAATNNKSPIWGMRCGFWGVTICRSHICLIHKEGP